ATADAPGARRTSALNDVVHRRDARLTWISPYLGENWNQRRAERLKRLLGVPHIEHLDLAVHVESDVIEPPGWRSGTGPFESLDCVVVRRGRERTGGEVHTECHGCWPFHVSCSVRARTCVPNSAFRQTLITATGPEGGGRLPFGRARP